MSTKNCLEIQETIDHLRRQGAASQEALTDAQRLTIAYQRLAEEMAARQASDQARFRLAAIVESAEAALISKDLSSIIQSWNPGAERLFGYTAKEMIGRSVLLLLPIGREQEEFTIMERLKKGECIQQYEALRRHKNGTLFPVSLTISPVKDNDGKIIGVSKIARDVSNRKQMEAQAELITELQNALTEIRTLRGFIPICAHCKKIRDDAGFWQQIEQYLHTRTDARFTHGVCPSCIDKHYGELMNSQAL